MASLTVPIYYGCSNIEELVPADCFVDYRRFSSMEELDDFLQAMTDEEYLGYAERMRVFVKEYNAPERHSAYRLYEAVVKTMDEYDSNEMFSYPRDYLAESSFAGKLRFLAMKLLLPHHRLVYSMFAVARFFGK